MIVQPDPSRRTDTDRRTPFVSVEDVAVDTPLPELDDADTELDEEADLEPWLLADVDAEPGSATTVWIVRPSAVYRT